MGRFATGVTVLTVNAPDARPLGMTASSLASVSLVPPLVSVCVDHQAELHDAIIAAPVFVVNVLASEQQRLAEIFAGGGGVYGDQRFAEADWTTLTTGAPVLRPCLATFDCRLVEHVPASSHSIFIGCVAAVELDPDLDPLVYVEGDYSLIVPFMTSDR